MAYVTIRFKDMLDSYLCPKCKGMVPEINNTGLSFCINCGEKYDLKPFRKINNEAQKYLESECSSCRVDVSLKFSLQLIPPTNWNF